MTVTADLFLAAADMERRLGPRPGVVGPARGEPTAGGVARVLVLCLLLTALALAAAASSRTATVAPTPGRPGPTSVTTDTPIPASVLRLERDPLR
jgi:hypothetical protein